MEFDSEEKQAIELSEGVSDTLLSQGEIKERSSECESCDTKTDDNHSSELSSSNYKYPEDDETLINAVFWDELFASTKITACIEAYSSKFDGVIAVLRKNTGNNRIPNFYEAVEVTESFRGLRPLHESIGSEIRVCVLDEFDTRRKIISETSSLPTDLILIVMNYVYDQNGILLGLDNNIREYVLRMTNAALMADRAQGVFDGALVDRAMSHAQKVCCGHTFQWLVNCFMCGIMQLDFVQSKCCCRCSARYSRIFKCGCRPE